MEASNSLPVKLQPSNLRPIAYRVLSKKYGLNIKTDALLLLTEVIGYKFGSDWKGSKTHKFLEDVAKIWKTEDRGLFIDGDGLKQVLKVVETSKNKIADKAKRMDTLVDDVDMMNETDDKEEESVIQWVDYFRIINPPEQPNYKFDRHRKQFIIQDSKPRLSEKLGSNLKSSIEMFNDRYHLIMDRLSRNENFRKTSFSSISSITKSLQEKSISNEITLIANMLGRDGQKFILFGLLSKNPSGQFILEDCSEYVELNLSQTFKTEGSFYGVGMFVIVEGIYSASGGVNNKSSDYMGGCFYVSNIGHPPAEKRDISMDNYGNVDFLGINKEIDKSTGNEKILRMPKSLKKKLMSLEKTLLDHKIILLGSDCYLDDFKIVAGLKKFFKTLEIHLQDENESIIASPPPLAIIMTGSFSSKPLVPTSTSTSTISHSEEYKSNFDNLASILAEFPNIIRSCKFVLIPGKNDPWQSTYSLGSTQLNTIPGRPLPHLFVARLERLLPKGNLILAWNPTRINFLSQEIVIVKDEYINKFKRNDIVFANDLEVELQNLAKEIDINDDERVSNLINAKGPDHVPIKIKQARKIVKTLLDQGTLQPFLCNLKVVDSYYDYIIRLEPLPNVVILNDSKFENFEVTYNGCKVVNITKLTNANSRKLNYLEFYPSRKYFDFKELYF